MNDAVVGEIVGCDSLYFAKVTEDTLDAYKTTVPQYLAPLGELKHDTKSSAESSSYDNNTMFTYYSESGEDTLTVSGLSEKRKAELTGKSVDPVTGRILDSGDLSYVPYYALGYRISIGNGDYVYRWFLKGTFSLGSEDAKSKGEKVEAKGIELTFTPVATVHKWQIPDPRDPSKTILAPQKKVSDDTTNPKFTDSESWFLRVQTPETHGDIPAVTVTVTPESAATGIAADAKITLVFNNTIASDSVTLMTDEAASIVAATKTYSADAKTITLTPTAALTAGATYSILIVGVVDAYGQTLDPQTSKFTVAP